MSRQAKKRKIIGQRLVCIVLENCEQITVPSRNVKAVYEGKYIKRLEFYNCLADYCNWNGEKRDPFKRIARYADITQIHGIRKHVYPKYIESTPCGEDNLLQSVRMDEYEKVIVEWDVDCGMEIIEDPNDEWYGIALSIDSVENKYYDKVIAWSKKVNGKWMR